MKFFKDKRYLVVLITLIFSITYISALDMYDQEEMQIAKLYKAVSIADIIYEQIQIDIKGTTEDKEPTIEEVIEKEQQCNKTLSHTKECSKLCVIEHPVLADIEILTQDSYVSATSSHTQDMSTYSLNIRNTERNPETTIYNMKIQGLQDVDTIDHMRNRSIDLFKEWNITPNETISFIGYIDGKLESAQKETYKTQLLKSLQGKFVDHYQDDYNQTTEAYYGYTPLIKDYTTTQTGQKTNTQITFTYNELLNQTQIIIAFPFYNNLY